MLTLRIDTTSYDQCGRENLRAVPAVGFKVDFAELSADPATLGLWHLHNGQCLGEGTGLEDASGGNHLLSSHGVTDDENGYRFVRSEAAYLNASFSGQPEQPQMTLEAWVQSWGVPQGEGGYIAHFRRSATAYFALWAFRGTLPADSFICATLRTPTATYQANWNSTDADAILASEQAWHVAGGLDASGTLRLWVNGTLRAAQSSASPLPAGTWTLYLGRSADSSAYYLSAIVDEVRLSNTARYSAAFSPVRLTSGGVCTSPTLDCARTSALWSDLLSALTLPDGTGLAWEVRASNSVDSAGPVASWQPYDGDPSGLPRGRYLQWRATFSSSPDRHDSPTLSSVDALASDAGYNLYHATGGNPDLLDPGEPWARVGPGVTQLLAGPLDAGAVHWFSVRPVDRREVESPIAQGEVRLELDGQGQPVPDRPAGVLALSARAAPGGCAKVAWSYRVGQTGALPHVFRIFGDGGSGVINYAAPLGETPYRPTRSSYCWTSGQLAGGDEQQLAVRAITAGGVWDEQPATAAVTCDPAAPGEVSNLRAEVIL